MCVYTAHQLTTVSKELETERGKVAQLKRDMEGFKKKAKSDQEKATRMVGTHVLLEPESKKMQYKVGSQ